MEKQQPVSAGGARAEQQSQTAVSEQIDALHRTHFGRLVATLTRVTGDLSLAEDVVQDAFGSALKTWPVHGTPERPVAWLASAARNAAIDLHRKRRVHTDNAAELTYLTELEQPDTIDMDLHPALRDDMLRLIFTCCHPALSLEARVALTLKTIGGMATAEIAKAFITPEPTLAQRLVRAKQKIKTAKIAYRVPVADDLTERLPGVLAVIYLIFNEGYLSSGDGTVRPELTAQAISLARTLCSVLSVNVEAEALLALMLLQNSRCDARFFNGKLVLLADQDRSLWDQEQISEGTALVNKVFSAGAGNRIYALQAAIAALHATAKIPPETDWQQIAELYACLAAIDPSPVIELNRSVAVAEYKGPKAGLELLNGLSESKTMLRYHLYHSARAEMYRRLGDYKNALAAYKIALENTNNTTEQEFLRERIQSVTR